MSQRLATIRGRIDEVLGGDANDRVAERLAEHGYEGSRDRVRRYRGGHAAKIDAEFVAAVALAYNVSPAWLLLEEGPRERKASPWAGVERVSGAELESLQALLDQATGTVRELRARYSDAIPDADAGRMVPGEAGASLPPPAAQDPPSGERQG